LHFQCALGHSKKQNNPKNLQMNATKKVAMASDPSTTDILQVSTTYWRPGRGQLGVDASLWRRNQDEK